MTSIATSKGRAIMIESSGIGRLDHAGRVSLARSVLPK
jgi:hypothetical protein